MSESVIKKVMGWQLALDRAPMFISVMLMFLVPLVTQPEAMDPICIKLVYCQILTFIMASVWMVRSLQSGRVTYVYTCALWPLAAIVLWTALSAMLSPCPEIAWHAWEQWVCFPLMYFVLTSVCLALWQAENLLIVWMVVGGISAVWGLLQSFGLSSGPWQVAVQTQFSDRAIAGMGNPDFFAGYLLLTWPLALALYLRAKQPITKIIWMLVTVISWAALFLTRSKAAILGLGFGLAIFLALFLSQTNEDEGGKAQKKGVQFLIIVILLIGAYPAFQLLKNLGVPANPSIHFREMLWPAVWKMSLAHPFTGVGWGVFTAAFPNYQPISLAMSQTEMNYEVNEAHNWVLSWLSQTGLVGLMLVLSFVLIVLFQWWKLYKAKAIPPALGAGAFAAFGGLALDNFFDINSALPSTLVPLLFLCALPVALSQRFYRLPGFPIQAREVSLEGKRTLWVTLALLVTALCFLQVWKGFETQWSQVQLKKGMRLSQVKKWDDALKSYDKSALLDPDNTMACYFRGSAYLDRGRTQDLTQALSDFTRVTSLEPDYLLVHFKKAQVLERLALSLNPRLVEQLPAYNEAHDKVGKKDYSGALVIYQKLVFDYPTCIPALVDAANCLFLLGRKSDAQATYQAVLQLDPYNTQAKLNLSQLLQTQHI
jgi:O-antigen ligase